MSSAPGSSPRGSRSTNAPSPTGYGLFKNRLFNDDASRNRAELEPIDSLTRSTTPRAGYVAIALGVLAVAIAGWLWLGSIDHSLWLTGRLLDMPAPDAGHNGAPENLIRIETDVRRSDARHPIAGMKIIVFRNDSAGTFLSGTIRAVHPEEPRASPGRPTATQQLDIAPDPSSAFPALRPGKDYRLRIPVGSQRPIELLLGFASPRLAGEP